MLRMYTRSEAEGAFPGSPVDADYGLAGLLKDVEAGGRPVVAVHAARSARSGFVDWLLPALRQDRIRSVLVSGPDEAEISLAALMDQVVGSVCANQVERLERCHAVLTTLAPGETRIALVIEDAHRLSDQCFRYLELVTSITRSSGTPLLILLVGDPAIWDRLPQTGALAAENVACCLSLGDPTGLDEPEAADASAEPDEGASTVVEVASMVPALILPERARPKRRWIGWAACAGSFAVAGGLAATLYPDGPLMARFLPPRVMMTEASPVTDSPMLMTIASPVAIVPRAGEMDVPHEDAAVVGGAPPGGVPEPVPAQDTPVAEAQPSADVAVPVPVTAPVVVAVPVTAPVAVVVPVRAPVAVDAPVRAPQPADGAMSAADAAAMAANIASPAGTAVAAAVAMGLDVPPADSAAAVVTPAPVAVTPPVPVAVPAPVDPAPVPTGIMAVLIGRGDSLLAIGDVTAARLMYRRAADAQSVAGIVAMGMTFDPKVLAEIGVQGLGADRQQAAMWYQRAAGLGSLEAVRLLRHLRDEGGEATELSASATHRSDPGR